MSFVKMPPICSEDTMRWRHIQYLTEGFDLALEDKVRPGSEPALKAQQKSSEISSILSLPSALA